MWFGDGVGMTCSGKIPGTRSQWQSNQNSLSSDLYLLSFHSILYVCSLCADEYGVCDFKMNLIPSYLASEQYPGWQSLVDRGGGVIPIEPSAKYEPGVEVTP